MKGGAFPAKRRWKGLLVIAVLCLVFLSMLVPLVFLLGQHNNAFRNPIGHGTHERNSVPIHVPVYDQEDVADARNQPKHFEDISGKEAGNDTDGFPLPPDLPKQVQKNLIVPSRDRTMKDVISTDDNEMICELKFGSYCLWRREHKEKMNDTVVRQMKDLLFVARAYFPSIAKLPALEKLSQEMKQNIQDFERILSESTTDEDIPPQIEKKLARMKSAISKAKSCHVDCNNVDKKFRQLVDLTEDEANFHMKQSAFLYKLAVQTMPKSLHCLSMRLTVEYFKSSIKSDKTLMEKFVDPNLYHYIIFSRSVLPSSIVINSTVLHAKESEKLVFHVLTDSENYFGMKLWFSRNKYRDSAVEVLNIEDLQLHNDHHLTSLHLSLPEEFRISVRSIDKLSSTTEIKTEYLSMFSHSHYLLPEIFQTLKKVVVLDDDVLVQRDLSDLWSLDMGGKVNGAVQFCGVKLFHLKNYLSTDAVDDQSCAWTSGINLIDLFRWRKHNISETYQKLVHKMEKEHGLSETTSLGASLRTFKGHTYNLEDSWILSGLGHTYGIYSKSLKEAPVLHFDGSMKPWLDIGIRSYRGLWWKYVNKQNNYLSECNVNS